MAPITLSEKSLISLTEKEGWEVVKITEPEPGKSPWRVIVDGEERPLTHPFFLHLRAYRQAEDADVRFDHVRRAHDLLWPQMVDTWNEWDERAFRAHCMNYRGVVMAGGASSGKSHRAARIALLFWLSDPLRNTCIVASTTLESLESRIWGYVARFFRLAQIELPANYMRSKPPKILHPKTLDKIHGMFAVAIRMGEEENVLSTLIGRHPERGLMIVLDEATDMSPSIIKSIPNLEEAPWFQLWAIGNSNDRNDLHGSLATPRVGWKKINPKVDFVWETVRRDSICLYFNPHDSPAIHEPDPEKRERLGRFLITKEEIEEKKAEYGEESDSYFRFVLGFWKPTSMGNVIASEPFLKEHRVGDVAEWSGFYPLQVVGGLDPAFQSGGTDCVLRLGILGQTTDGMVRLDFRGNELLFKIPIVSSAEESAELRLCQEILKRLMEFGCPVRNVVIDASGVGRALGELLKILSGENDLPWRIVSQSRGRRGINQKDTEPRMVTATPTDLWQAFQQYVQMGQIRGIDPVAMRQITTRLISQKAGKTVLETKSEYQARLSAISPKLGASPDEADTVMLCVQAAVLQFGWTPGQRRALPAGDINDFWWQKMRALVAENQAPTVAAAQRAPLLPNFAGALEDMPKDADSLPVIG